MSKLRHHLRLLERAQREIDAGMAEQIRRHAPTSGYPSCKPGCSACCRQLVWAELIEAQQIIDTYPDVVDRVRPEIERAADLCDTLPDDDYTDPHANPRQDAAAEWWRVGLGCPFLRDNRCSIYRVRPMVCRVHFVVSPPEQCAAHPGRADYAQPVTLLDVGGTRYNAPQHVRKIGASLRAAPGAQTSMSIWGTFPQILREALRLRDSRPHGKPRADEL